MGKGKKKKKKQNPKAFSSILNINITMIEVSLKVVKDAVIGNLGMT